MSEQRKAALAFVVEKQGAAGLFDPDGKPTRDMAIQTFPDAPLEVLVNLNGRGVTVRSREDGSVAERFTWREVMVACDAARKREYARRAFEEFKAKARLP